MKHFLFTLSMPNNNSWNGRWTGEGNDYVIVRSFPEKHAAIKNIAQRKFHSYNFGDGWGAKVSITEITGDEKRKALHASKGFYGYDWMVDEICSLGRIRTREEM